MSFSCWAEESNFNLPDLGSANRASFSQQQESVLSLAFLEALYQQADIIEDPELNQYIRDIGNKLLRHVHSERKFQFYIIKDNAINAFAGPGGIIAIHSGLILAAKNEDEIAAVMAHEIEHVQQEHISRMFSQSKTGMLATAAGIVGALLVGSKSPQAAMAMMTGGMAYSAQQQLAFSRDNEWEADRFGIDILSAAGYDPNAMADFFETLGERYRNDGNTPEILMTHPVTSKRIADSRARARMLHTPKASKEHNLDLVHTRLKTLLRQDQVLTDPKLICYQQQVAHSLNKASGAPAPTCRNLPDHLWSKLILLQNQDIHAKQADWQTLIDIYPHNSAVLLHYADYLLATNQNQILIDQLSSRIDYFNERWALWEPIARAWNQLGDSAREAYAMAQAYESIGALILAKIQIDRALRNSDASSNSRLKERIESLKANIELAIKLRKEL